MCAKRDNCIVLSFRNFTVWNYIRVYKQNSITRNAVFRDLSLGRNCVVHYVLPAMHEGHHVCHRSSHVAVVNKIQHTADHAHRSIHRRVVGGRWMGETANNEKRREPANSKYHVTRDEIIRLSRRISDRYICNQWSPFLTSWQFQ